MAALAILPAAKLWPCRREPTPSRLKVVMLSLQKLMFALLLAQSWIASPQQ
jgi:hypothetical protein